MGERKKLTPDQEEIIHTMKANNIPINDLHSVITKWDGYAEWKKGDDVHFSGGVYAMLAEQIAEMIVAQLGSSDEAKK